MMHFYKSGFQPSRLRQLTRKGGLIAIIFDEGGYTVSVGTAGAVTITFEGQYCSSEQPGPNLAPFPQTNTIRDPFTPSLRVITAATIPGGVLLSPLLKPGTVSNTPFNHYSLLKALEDIYHTNGYLGYAGRARPAVVVRMRFVGHKTERFRSGRCLETAVTRDWQAEAPAAPHGTWEITLESTRNLR